MKTLPLAALLGLAAAACSTAETEPPAPAWTGEARSLLEEAYPAGEPGASVIVTRGGETLFAAGRGLADLETGRENTPDTVFRLGSITKQFAAAVILQLAEEGALSLDDRLSDYLPDYPEPGASATIRQLLNHTSGVQSYTSIPGWMVEENTARPYTTEEMLAVFRDLPSPTAPGEAWSYNNSGYVLVGAVIEAVDGRPWHVAVRERIAEPLGLETLRYGVEEADIAEMAQGYTHGEEGWVPAQAIHMSVPHAAGALIASAPDLADWAEALHGGEVVNTLSYAEMIAPTELPGGAVQEYGFGLGLSEIRGHDAIGHGGGIFGFSTDSVYLPDQDLFVAVLANSDQPQTSPSTLMRRLAALAAGDPYERFTRADIDPAALEPLFGVYEIGEGVTRRFYARDGRLYTLRSGGSESEVFAAGDGRFFYGPDSLTWFEIERGGEAPVMVMHQNGEAEGERAVRTGPVPAGPEPVEVPRETLERYVGDYALGGSPVRVFFAEDGALTTQVPGQPPFALLATSRTRFQLVGIDAAITFLGEDGPAEAIVIEQGGQEFRAERMAE